MLKELEEAATSTQSGQHYHFRCIGPYLTRVIPTAMEKICLFPHVAPRNAALYKVDAATCAKTWVTKAIAGGA